MATTRFPIKVAPDILMVTDGELTTGESHSYLLEGDRPTLVDCGGPKSTDQLFQSLHVAGYKITDIVQVIATHADYGRIAGFSKLLELHPSLQLHMHPLAWQVAESGDSYRNGAYLQNSVLEPLQVSHHTLPCHGEYIWAGNGEWQVLHTPGDNEGAICLAGTAGGQRLIIAGGTVGGFMRSLEGADLSIWVKALLTWKQSLTLLASLEFDVIFNSYDRPEKLPISRDMFLRYLKYFGAMINPWAAGVKPIETTKAAE
jgi:glyoxylase-like metal-dependent hydrolase (beta-lactamase superfamily II)